MVTSPNGGEVWPAEQQFPIHWRGNDFGGTGALSFDGTDDYVVLPGEALDGLADMTAEFWLSTQDTGPQAIISGANAGNSREYLVLLQSDTELRLYSGESLYSYVSWTIASVADGAWHHFAVVRDDTSNEATLYLDGGSQGTVSTTLNPLSIDSAGLILGQDQSSVGGGFSSTTALHSQLEEIRLWDAVRSETDILGTMNTVLVGTETNLRGYWPLDAVDGDDLPDETSNHFNGTLGGDTPETHPTRVASHAPLSNVTIELIEDGNPTTTAIAVDELNDGHYSWTIPASITPGTSYRARVTRSDDATLTGQSDDPFEITAPIHVYYVNDGTALPGDWTTSPGDDVNNDGLSSDRPMASVSAVLAAYSLGENDEIWVDNGTYSLTSNLSITPDDSGVTIKGYFEITYPDRRAVLDRGNTSSGSYVVEMGGADQVTLEHLTLTGGYHGLYGSTSADSDAWQVLQCELVDNSYDGVSVTSSNDDLLIWGSDVHGNGNVGIDLSNAPRGQVIGNDVYDNPTGIAVNGSSLSTSDQIVIQDNQVHGNSAVGVTAAYNVLVTGNTVYGHSGSGDRGIYVSNGNPTISQNTVHDNYNGIETNYYYANVPLIEKNRVFHNSNRGILATRSSIVRENVVYANSVGIEGNSGSYTFSGEISNNLVYANTNHGIWVVRGSGAEVVNNTVYQQVGDAVRVTGGSSATNVRNNILWVEAGYAIYVASDSQVGFQSDYNDLVATETGFIGFWEGQAFDTLASWRFEVNQDWYSRAVDPLFVEIAGLDDILGFSTSPVSGTTQIIDDGDTGFAQSGTWNSSTNGYQSDSLLTTGAAGVERATWTFTGLTPGWYDVAATWPVSSGLSRNASYHVYDGPRLAGTTDSLNQNALQADLSDAGVDWQRLGYYYLRGDTLVVELTNQDYYTAVADALRIEQIEGDHGSDDNFLVQSTSLTIDAGSLADYYLAEPTPNGGRINQGHTGNTPAAAVSPAELVQVLSPNGLEKFEEGQSVPIEWRSAGLTAVAALALVNSGGSTVDNWLSDRYRTAGTNTSFTNTVDTSGVTNPVLESVYQSYSYASSGVDNRLTYELPVPDGTYTVRLHFVEPSYTSSGSRQFDITLQGATVVTAYDIYAAAGARYKATTLSYTVDAAAGTGIQLELVNRTSNPAVLSAVEVTSNNPSGVPDPQVTLEVSHNDGSSWEVIATDLSMDRFGRGSHTWTADNVPTNDALMRVTPQDGSSPPDISDESFLITDAGTEYYISPTGDNAASGKDANAPMASLAALLTAYDLDPGDTIHVAAGTYQLIRNIVLAEQDSGVRILGPESGTAVLDRGNTSSGSYVVEMGGADQVTLEHLTLTGGYHGLYGSTSADSDAWQVLQCELVDNSYDGVSVTSSNDDLLIWGSDVHGNGNVGIDLSNAPRGQVIGNDVYDNPTGIAVNGSSLSTSDQIVIQDNQVHGNSAVGVTAAYNVLVTGNTVYGHSGSGDRGIYVSNGNPTISQNTVHDNYNGIETNYYYANVPLIEKNRVFHNSNRGILATRSSIVRENVVYANSVGIEGNSGSYTFSGEISNNLVYANTNHGIWVVRGSGAEVVNNTVYQQVGDAVRVTGGSSATNVRNNILWVEAGYAIYVASDSQVGFQSDYNLFALGSDLNADAGYWSGDQHTLADWHTASGQDQFSDDGDDTNDHSREGDPRFVDINGADNVLGYSTIGLGYDGGQDDNFYLAAFSPAIDRADAWAAPATDLGGYPRVDDPASLNLGSDNYAEDGLGTSLFTATGTARGWRSNGTNWNLTLPFAFPFYGTSYSTVAVSTEGFSEIHGCAEWWGRRQQHRQTSRQSHDCPALG